MNGLREVVVVFNYQSFQVLFFLVVVVVVVATFLEMKPEAVLRHASLQSTKKVAMAVLAIIAVLQTY